MNAFKTGFYKQALDGGLTKDQTSEMWKAAMGFQPAANMFNQGPEGNEDLHQLELAASMQDQINAENDLGDWMKRHNVQ